MFGLGFTGWRDAKITEVQSERDYWKARAERLIDAGLARTGAIHAPTMEQRILPSGLNAIEQITAAMTISEIDSTKRPRS